MNESDSDKLFNPKHTKAQRKYLRNNSTKSEIILWTKFKGRNLSGYKFRRQHGVGNYILDFYCPSLNLAIEIDGEPHFSKSGKQKDQKKDQFLNEAGISVLRFTNNDILQNIEGVVTALENHILKIENYG